jgi:hypothetical protein
MMEAWGNDRVNHIYEANIPSSYLILRPNCSGVIIDQYIRDKYVKKLFYKETEPLTNESIVMSHSSAVDAAVEDTHHASDLASFNKAVRITEQVMSLVGADHMCCAYVHALLGEIGADFSSYSHKFSSMSPDQSTALLSSLRKVMMARSSIESRSDAEAKES